MTETAVFNPEAHVAGILARHEEKEHMQTFSSMFGREMPLSLTADEDRLHARLFIGVHDWSAVWRSVTEDVWDCHLWLGEDTERKADVSYVVDFSDAQYRKDFPFKRDVQSFRDNPLSALFASTTDEDARLRKIRASLNDMIG